MKVRSLIMVTLLLSGIFLYSCQKENLQNDIQVEQLELVDGQINARITKDDGIAFGPTIIPCRCSLRVEEVCNADFWEVSTDIWCNPPFNTENLLTISNESGAEVGTWYPFICEVDPNINVTINFASFIDGGPGVPVLTPGIGKISIACTKVTEAGTSLPGSGGIGEPPFEHGPVPDLTFSLLSKNHLPNCSSGKGKIKIGRNCSVNLTELNDPCESVYTGCALPSSPPLDMSEICTLDDEECHTFNFDCLTAINVSSSDSKLIASVNGTTVCVQSTWLKARTSQVTITPVDLCGVEGDPVVWNIGVDNEPQCW